MSEWGWRAYEKRACRGKMAYVSKKHAEKKAREYMTERPERPLYIYRCPLWSPAHWHLTHVPMKTNEVVA